MQQALPATQEAAGKSAGFLAKLFGASNRETTPLDEALTGYQQPSHVAPPSTPPTTESTTLDNGVKIVSEATYVSLLTDWLLLGLVTFDSMI